MIKCKRRSVVVGPGKYLVLSTACLESSFIHGFPVDKVDIPSNVNDFQGMKLIVVSECYIILDQE
ncbi:activating signal cointegrator 1 complex subunit [Orobanche hederae]